MAKKPQGPQGPQGAAGATGSASSGGQVSLSGPNNFGSGGSGTTVSGGASMAGPVDSSGGVPTNYTPIPSALLTAAGLPANASVMLQYWDGNVMRQPRTGSELWAAINTLTDIYRNQSTFNFDYNKLEKLQTNLKNAYFPAGFNGGGKYKNKIFSAVTTNLQSNLFQLAGLKAPTPADYLSNAVATQLNLLKSQNNQLTAAVNNASIAQEQSAFGQIQNYLEQWGLTNLSQDFYNIITKVGDHVTNTDALLNIMRGAGTTGNRAEDARLQGAYNERFAGLNDYNKNPANTVKMTESAYQQYTAAIQDASGQYGVPQPTQQEIGKLLNGNVSASEYKQRVQDIYSVIQNADQNTKNLLKQQYGVDTQHLFQYMTTGALPDRQRQVASASVQDYAQRVGLTGIGQAQGEQLAQMAKLAGTAGNQGLGYGLASVESSLLGAAKDVQLTRGGMPGTAAPTVDTNTLIGAQLAGFGGTTQVQAQTQVARAEQARVAPFEKGGGYTETGKGVVGLGSARS
jgi:hypothetical protein